MQTPPRSRQETAGSASEAETYRGEPYAGTPWFTMWSGNQPAEQTQPEPMAAWGGHQHSWDHGSDLQQEHLVLPNKGAGKPAGKDLGKGSVVEEHNSRVHR